MDLLKSSKGGEAEQYFCAERLSSPVMINGNLKTEMVSFLPISITCVLL